MADEPQSTETEQPDINSAVASQPPATVVTVYDSEGREHFAASTSKFVVDGLADGTLTADRPADDDESGDSGQSTEEVPSGAETGSAGHDPKPGTADGTDGPGDGAPEATGTSRRRRTGTA
jgi:hypothetical protein